MKSFETDLKKYSEKINLKLSERRELRERILSYMEYHPLPKQTVRTQDFAESIPSELFVTLHFNTIYARFAVGFAVMLLIAAPFVAERSVPGDVLYLVKTGFNEPIQGQLANSPYEKIEFETKLMERRISEARVLVTEGKLTEEVKTQLAENVKEHTEAVQHGLAELRVQDSEGAAIAEIAFNSSLEVQSAVLDANDNVDNASLIENILTVVNDAREEVVANQGGADGPSFESLSAQVEIETTRALELFTVTQRSATKGEERDIKRRLSDIDRLILEAKDLYTTEPFMASNDLANTLGLLQKLIVFMTDIDVRETVTLDSIVPVVLSAEERMTIVRNEVLNTRGLLKKIQERIVPVDEVGVGEKVTEGIASSEELLLKTLVALDVSDIEVAENAMKEVQALVADLDSMTQKYITAVPLPVALTTEGQATVATSTEDVTVRGSSTPAVLPEMPTTGE